MLHYNCLVLCNPVTICNSFFYIYCIKYYGFVRYIFVLSHLTHIVPKTAPAVH